MLDAVDDGQEAVAGELADLAGEQDGVVGKEDLGLADAAGVGQQLAGSRIARGVLVIETEIQVAERDPARFAAPPNIESGALDTAACP